MFDLGWWEMAVIAFIALMVIGPKELPQVLRSVGHWSRKARALAREFQSGVDDMIREADLEDAKKTLDSARKLDLGKTLEDTLDPTGEVKDEVRGIEDSARDVHSIEDSARDMEPADKEPADKEPADEGQVTTAASGDAASEIAADAADSDHAGDADDDGPKATIIKHPLQVAPPHSITPPPGEEAAPAPGDGGPGKTPGKTVDKTPETTA